MKNFKKYISLILIFVFLCACSVSANAGKTVVSNTDEAMKAYDFLMAVGALDENEKAFEASFPITRSHFVKLALHLSNDAPQVLVQPSEVFEDVTPSTDYASYIETAYRIGYISGSSSGIFNPSATITLSEALKILCNILGYGQLAEASGGYPAGYMTVAGKIGLLDGISVNDYAGLSMTSAILLLRNAAETDLMEIKSYSDTVNMEARDGKTLLTERHKVQTAEGVITATAYTELYSQDSGLERGQIKLGEKIYSSASSGCEDYLGYDVVAYFDTSSDKVFPDVLWVEENTENRVITVQASDDIAAVKDEVTYSDSNGNLKKIRISPEATYIVNGKMAAVLCEDIDDIEKGTLRFVSNNGDSEVDVVAITKYDTYLVSGVSKNAEIITTKDGSVIELESDSDDYTVAISKDDYAADISTILANDVLVVAESRGTGLCHKEVIVSRNMLESSFEEIGDDFAVVEGDRYPVDSSVLGDIRLGVPYTIRFDTFGNISFIDNIRDYVYGYLYGIMRKGFNKPVCRVFSEMNRWVDLSFADKVEFNGEKISGDALYEELSNLGDGKRQLIRYKVNSGAELISMQTAEKVLLGSAKEIEAFEKDQFRISYTGSLFYSNTAGSLGGVVFAGDNAKIFVVPDDLDMDKFKIMKKSKLIPNKFYPITAYDVDKYLNCDIAVIDSDIAADKTPAYTDKFMIVDSVGTILDSENDAATSIRGYWKDGHLAFPVKTGDGGVSEETLASLKRGDIIIFKYDDKSNINFIQKFDLTEGYYKPASTHADFAVFAGKVVECNYSKNRMRFKYSESDADITLDYTTSTTFYMYDVKTETYSISSPTEILPEDTVYVNTRYFRCYDVVILRK